MTIRKYFISVQAACDHLAARGFEAQTGFGRHWNPNTATGADISQDRRGIFIIYFAV